MPETSQQRPEQFSAPETPPEKNEKDANVLPIRPDVVIPGSEPSVPEGETKATIDKIREINRKILDARREYHHVDEGLAEDLEEAGRQLLKNDIFSRVQGLFRKKKAAEPLRYDNETRKELLETKTQIAAEMTRLSQERTLLLGQLPPKAREQLVAEFEELRNIQHDLDSTDN